MKPGYSSWRLRSRRTAVIFITVIIYNSEEGATTNATTNWQTKLEVSGILPIPEGGTARFKLYACCEYSGSLTTQLFEVRVLLDGVEVSTDVFKPTNANEPKKFMDFGFVELSPGTHSLTLQFRPRTSGTATCRRARLMVEKY